MEEIDLAPLVSCTASYTEPFTGRADPTLNLSFETRSFKARSNSIAPKSVQTPSSLPRRGPFGRVKIRPLLTIDENDPWSPQPSFAAGTVNFLYGKTFTFGAKPVPSHSGNSAGFCCSRSLFEQLVGGSTPWCWVEHDYNHGTGISRAAIVKIDLPSVGLSTYTFALEIPDADIAPILGRFLVTDALTLVSQGYLASPASLPLKEGKLADTTELTPIIPGFYSVTKPPDWPTIRKRYAESAMGKNLKADMLKEYQSGADFKKQGDLESALRSFQRVSVYGFFTMDNKELAATNRALAATYRDLGNADLALIWAKRSRELHDDEGIRAMIAKMEKS